MTGWRHVANTQRRTMQDFAHRIRWLVGEAYPQVPVVRLAMDNPVLGHGSGSEHPPDGVAVKDVSANGDKTHRQAAGVPLHA